MKPTELFGIDPDFVAAPSDYEQGRLDERERILAALPAPKYNGEWWYFFTDVQAAIKGTDA